METLDADIGIWGVVPFNDTDPAKALWWHLVLFLSHEVLHRVLERV